MKFRKEFVFFIIAILIIIAVVAFGSISTSKKYSKKDVKISFEDSESITNEDNSEDSSDESLVNDDAMQESEVKDATEVEIENTEESTETSTEVNENFEEEETEEELLDSDSEIEPHLALDDDSVMILVQYYVCNLNDDEGFDALLTNELVADRENRLSSEPYSSLNGVTSLKALKKDGNFITITTNEDITYKFECKYTDDGSKISDIVYINE